MKYHGVDVEDVEPISLRIIYGCNADEDDVPETQQCKVSWCWQRGTTWIGAWRVCRWHAHLLAEYRPYERVR